MAIRMTPEGLRSLANSVTSIRDDILCRVNDMDTKINNETAEWDGASKDQYFTDYEEVLPYLRDKFPQVIEDLATRLIFAADTLEQADHDIAQKLQG